MIIITILFHILDALFYVSSLLEDGEIVNKGGMSLWVLSMLLSLGLLGVNYGLLQ